LYIGTGLTNSVVWTPDLLVTPPIQVEKS